MGTPSILPNLWIVLAVAAALDAAGIYLLLTAWRRRTGRTPFCRNCGYNLTGTIPSLPAAAPAAPVATAGGPPRCPECGSGLDESQVRYGERRIRKPRLLAGLLLTSTTSVTLAWQLASALPNVDWYRHYPVRWVFDDLASADAAVADRAFDELQRRCLAESLAQNHLDRFVEQCLRVQAGPLETGSHKPKYRGRKEVVLLERLYNEGGLSPDQSRRFFETMFVTELSVRPRVGRDGPAIAEMRLEYHGARDAFQVRTAEVALLVDGSRLRTVPANQLGGGAIGTASMSSSRDLPVSNGRHEVVAQVAFTIHRATTEGAVQDVALHSETRTLEGIYEVLDVPNAELIQLVRSPELDRRMAAAVSLDRLNSFRRGGDASGWGFSSRVLLAEDAPLPVAFKVTVDFPEGPTAKSPMSLGNSIDVSPHRIDRLLSGDFTAATTGPEPRSATITLTPDPGHAAVTADLYEIWGGSLRFENVPLGGRSSSGRLVEANEPAPIPAQP